MSWIFLFKMFVRVEKGYLETKTLRKLMFFIKSFVLISE